MVVLNLQGREIIRLSDESQATGYHSVSWDGKNSQGQTVSGGMYFCRLEVPGKRLTNKMLLLK